MYNKIKALATSKKLNHFFSHSALCSSGNSYNALSHFVLSGGFNLLTVSSSIQKRHPHRLQNSPVINLFFHILPSPVISWSHENTVECDDRSSCVKAIAGCFTAKTNPRFHMKRLSRRTLNLFPFLSITKQ